MKNNYLNKYLGATLLVVGALLSPTMSAEVTNYPYAPSYSSLSSDGWEGYVSNSYQATITLGYSQTQNIKVERKSSCTARTRVFSPALEMKAGCRYTVSFSAAAINPSPAMTITPYLTSEVVKSLLTADGVAEKLLLTGETVATTNTTKKSVEFTYTPAEDATVYFMLDITTDNSAARTMYMSDFRVEELLLESKPEPVSNLSFEVVNNAAREIKLSWDNPTQNLQGDPVDIASVNIYRDGTVISRLVEAADCEPGASVSFTEVLPASGEYEYSVTVTGADGKESSPVSVQTPYVGNPDPLTVPVAFDFANASQNRFWNIVTAPNSNGWAFANYYSAYYLQCTLDGYRPTSSTAYTPEIALDNTKTYELTVTAQCTTRGNEFFYSIGLDSPEEDGDAQVIAERTLFMPAANNTDEELHYLFAPQSSGNMRLSFNAEIEALPSTYYSNTFKITALTLEETDIDPSAVATIESDSKPQMRVAGRTISAEGCLLSAYTPAGCLAAAGTDSLDLAALPAGIYVVTARNSRGVNILKIQLP